VPQIQFMLQMSSIDTIFTSTMTMLLLSCVAVWSAAGDDAAGAAPQIRARRPKVFGRRAKVTVRWSGVNSPSGEEWISAWSPPDFPVPVKMLPTNASSRWHEGHGELAFDILNIRLPLMFRLTSSHPTFDRIQHSKVMSLLPQAGDTCLDASFATHELLSSFTTPLDKGKVLAESNMIYPDSLPMQLHTSATSNPGELQIMFVDNSSLTPQVRYGYRELDELAIGSSIGYSLEDLKACNTSDHTAIERFIDPGHIHKVLLRGLVPGKPLYYSVGHVGAPAVNMSPIQRHAGALPASSEEVKILYLADQGAGPARADELFGALDSEGTAISRENAGPSSGGRLVLENLLHFERERLPHYNMVLHNGDISYGCGEGWLHEEYSTMIEPLAAAMPFMVSMGNHEFDHSTSAWPTPSVRASWGKGEFDEDSGGECGILYRKRWQMPEGTSSVMNKNLDSDMEDFSAFYSFDSGPIHFSVLSTEHDFTNASVQHLWLQRDLSAVNRSRTPWVVVMSHRPVYNGGLATSGLMGRMQQDLEPLFIMHNVDVVLTAHVHTYVRMCAMRLGKCVPSNESAPVYIVDGSAGSYTAGGWPNITGEGRSCPLPTAFEAPIVAGDCMWGWSRLVANRTSLLWEHLRWKDGTISDSITLQKPTPSPHDVLELIV